MLPAAPVAARPGCVFDADHALAAASPAIDAALRLPVINDRLSVAGPDVGAHESASGPGGCRRAVVASPLCDYMCPLWAASSCAGVIFMSFVALAFDRTLAGTIASAAISSAALTMR